MDQPPNIPSKQETAAPAHSNSARKGSLAALIVSVVALCLVAVYILTRVSSERPTAQNDPEILLLQAQVQEKRLALGLNASSGSYSPIKVRSLVERIINDGSSLSKMLEEFNTILTEKDQLLLAKQSELDSAALGREALTNQIGSLTQQLSELQRSNAESLTVQSQLADSKLLLDAANGELSRLRAKLDGSPTESALQSLADQLTISEQEVETLRDRLNAVVSQDEFDQLRKKNRSLTLELQALRAELNRKRLFAEDSNELSPNALKLHARLTTLEGVTNQERLTQYQDIKNDLNATVVETVAFETGSSAINVEKSNVILESLERTSPNSEYLIVGYASTTGDTDSNRGLSSKRATTVASLADQLRGQTQTVKAIYLGQTDRFSQLNDYANQVCEIWEILP